MKKMRKVLRALMTSAGETAYDLQARAGIPQPTTYRFLNATHGEPKGATVRRWAEAYDVTEAQLRGDDPIAGLSLADDLFDETGEEERIKEGQQGTTTAATKEQRAALRTALKMARRKAEKRAARDDLVLAAEKRDMIALMNSMGGETRQALLEIGAVLSRLQPERRANPDRRAEESKPNAARRRGETFHDPVVRSQFRRTDASPRLRAGITKK